MSDIEAAHLIAIIILIILGVVILIKDNMSFNINDYIKQLEQNNIEQTEEKEVYINRCKMLEDLMKENGIILDECECG